MKRKQIDLSMSHCPTFPWRRNAGMYGDQVMDRRSLQVVLENSRHHALNRQLFSPLEQPHAAETL